MSKHRSFFICGPKGCGKTTNAPNIARALGVTDVVDDWHIGGKIKRGAVHMTTASLDDVLEDVNGVGFPCDVWEYDAFCSEHLIAVLEPPAPTRACVPVTLAVPGYEKLADVLGQAFIQSSGGKGKERHANGLPWHEQPLIALARYTGHGGPEFQALKKLREAGDMANRGEKDAAKREILGAIVYAAAMFHTIDTQE